MIYKLLDFKKKLIIKYIFLSITLIFITKKYFNIFFFGSNYDEIKNKYADTIISSENTKGEYPGYDKLILNYEHHCSKYFKFRKNSRRDIVIFAYTYRPEKNFFQVFSNIIDSFKHSVPNAQIASVIPYKHINSEGAKLLEKYGIQLIPFKGYEDYSIVTSRYIAIYDFLKKNINKYKKVFLSDIDDVYMFRDIFSTFDENEIIINYII